MEREWRAAMLKKAKEDADRADEIKRDREFQVKEREQIKLARALEDKKQLMEIRQHWLVNDERAKREKLKLVEVSRNKCNLHFVIEYYFFNINSTSKLQ